MNIAGPDQLACDLLFSKTDWVFADYSSDAWIGGSTVAAAQASVPIWDLRAYKLVHAYLYCAGLTGGSSPIIFADLWAYDSADQSAAQGVQQYSGFSKSIAASGGSSQLVIGDGCSAATGTAQSVLVSPIRALFGRLNLRTSGSPTAQAAGGVRLFVYGVR